MNTARDLLAALLLTSLLALGCGGGQETPAQPEGEEEELDSEGKSWGGWRWKGKRNDCFFLYKNECFASLKAACAKARCGEGQCGHDESAPAKVSCAGDKKE